MTTDETPWYVTDKAIADATELLGFDDSDESWEHLHDLLCGLAFIARKKRQEADTLELWVCGQPHKRLKLLVSTRTSEERPKPQLIGVRRPHRGWRRPASPIRLPVLGSKAEAKALMDRLEAENGLPRPREGSPEDEHATEEPSNRSQTLAVLAAHFAVLEAGGDQWPTTRPSQARADAEMKETSLLEHVALVERMLHRRRQ